MKRTVLVIAVLVFSMLPFALCAQPYSRWPWQVAAGQGVPAFDFDYRPMRGGMGGMGGGYGRMGAGMMGGGMRGMGMLGGFAGIVDPPPGAAFRDPSEMAILKKQPSLVEIAIEAAWKPTQINGTTVNLLTFNGAYPSPTIRVHRGDKLRVRLRNSLPQGPVNNILGHDLTITNLHTHGLHVSPSGNSDNSMVVIRPGQEFQYEFDLALQEAGVLAYYHPHAHGTVAEQIWSGLGGALIVEDDTKVLAGLETHLLVLKDITVAGGLPVPHFGHMDFMRGKLGDWVMVNGQVNPVLSIRPGQIQRWRVLNASTARFYQLALEGHSLNLVGTDGGLLDKPYNVASISLAPGERVDLLVQGSASPGRYRLLSLPSADSMMCMGGDQQVTLMTVDCAGKAASDVLPKSVNPKAARVTKDLNALPRRQLVLSMGMGVGFINGITFSMDSAYTISSRLGTWEVWEVVNATCMAHPFHFHVNQGQVLSFSGGDPAYAALYTRIPAWKDTVIVPPGSSVTLLVSVEDFTGMAMFHCHILEHEDIGMMGLWEIK